MVDIIKLMNLHLLSHYSYLLPFCHILIVKLELIFKDLTIRVHSINLEFFPRSGGCGFIPAFFSLAIHIAKNLNKNLKSSVF